MDALLSLSPALRARLASALESGLLGSPYSPASLRSVLGLREGGETVSAALLDLEKRGISGRGAATWLETIGAIASQVPKPDLVWSGPEVSGLHARDTRRVYEELLGSAKQSVWVSTYAFFDGPKAFEILAQHLDANPAVQVTLLLNIQRKRGDSTAADHLVRQFADRFWKTDWPGKSHPRVYFEPRALELNAPSGVLHAKAVVADSESVFITSANLTEAAFDRNIEMGLFVRDKPLALSIICHFQGLIDQGLLLPLPNA